MVFYFLQELRSHRCRRHPNSSQGYSSVTHCYVNLKFSKQMLRFTKYESIQTQNIFHNISYKMLKVYKVLILISSQKCRYKISLYSYHNYNCQALPEILDEDLYQRHIGIASTRETSQRCIASVIYIFKTFLILSEENYVPFP